ncbi:MAG TPA: EAL domain-containing protein [Lautropia sp.]|nr:EAL domain-containing protein [Lautropia sp.]
MKRYLPPPLDLRDEVTELIATLHATERRLEELTAGEVDTVADDRGRTLLLRRAQEQLRTHEAFKQAAILDALPANIALLDGQGVIVSVNAAWRRFAGVNSMSGPTFGIGLNYLAVCDAATGDGAGDARQTAEGIRSVLSGATQHFALEYACNAPGNPRTYASTVTPLTGDGLHGVVVTHVDITAERHATDSLLESELRFRQMAENIRDVFFLREADRSQFLYVSPAYAEIWGRSCESLYADPQSWTKAIHPDDRAAAAKRQSVEADGSAFDVEYRIVRPDGTTRWVESRGYPVRDAAGRMLRIAGVTTDITERKEAERRIVYLNRVYAMLSGINSLIVRARDREELFREACQIAVTEGGFLTTWIGILDPSSMRLVPVASSGTSEGFLKSLTQRFAGGEALPLSRSKTGQAMSGRNPLVTNDLLDDPAALIAGLHARSNTLSLALLPLIVGAEAVGVLALYADSKDFFHDEELKLLGDLSSDIAFAIDHIDKRERLDYLAYYDALTGLANRSLFLERLAQYVRSAEAGGHRLALFLIDLSRFKNINDALGQAAGDALLRQVADWLAAHMGDSHLVARLSADRFAIVLPEARQGGNLVRMLERSMDAFLSHPFRLNDTVFRITSKVGAVIFPADGSSAEGLFRNAEAALKKAKAGGDRYLFYTPQMSDAASKLTLETELRQALDREEFLLFYQPKFESQSGRLCGAEALIRWNDPKTGLVAPGLFIPMLEETGLIHEVGRWAMRKAVEDYRRWRAMGLHAVRIAVNVSPLQLRHQGFVAEVGAALGDDSHASAGLELEVTESVIMESARHGSENLHAIRAMGVGIGIDDFGTGFSSLGYLSRLPVDTLKIDRSFVSEMTATQAGLALVSTIITLAHSLKLKVVAEGVETEEQARLLRLLNCDEMQGFLFSVPLPCASFEEKYLGASPIEP